MSSDTRRFGDWDLSLLPRLVVIDQGRLLGLKRQLLWLAALLLQLPEFLELLFRGFGVALILIPGRCHGSLRLRLLRTFCVRHGLGHRVRGWRWVIHRGRLG